jgi:hypothetical protein
MIAGDDRNCLAVAQALEPFFDPVIRVHFMGIKNMEAFIKLGLGGSWSLDSVKDDFQLILRAIASTLVRQPIQKLLPMPLKCG